ncbi:MAG: DNA replication/repair protein RecF [Caldilineales bacterium]|nr:DNA replication/repair protein RecF [Caldilineales bacterium]
MHLQRLSLTNYRNYARLELNLPPGLSIVQGENAQGKSNLLEAITVLATSRSPRSGSDTELVNWLAQESDLPFARLSAELKKGERLERVDITLLPAKGNGGFRKQVRINGAPRRALDLVGLMPVVLFRPEDVDLVSGSPSVRRRYLDIALCQMDPPYCRALNEYNKTVEQRNALLRNLQNGGNAGEQLRFWDDKLAETGSLIIAQRYRLIKDLDAEASLRHLDLSGGYERLKLRYEPSFDPAQPGRNSGGVTRANRDESFAVAAVRATFLAYLLANRRRDLAAGMTLSGPHRDDLGFYLGEHNLRSFGSRGQQRTAALASKMAEVVVMTATAGVAPLLLLDDVMSELDAKRRAMLQDALTTAPQAIVTTTDWHHFSPELLATAQRLHVHQGRMDEVIEPEVG